MQERETHLSSYIKEDLYKESMVYGVRLVESFRAQGQGMEIIHKEPKDLSTLLSSLLILLFSQQSISLHSFTRIAPSDLPYS